MLEEHPAALDAFWTSKAWTPDSLAAIPTAAICNKYVVAQDTLDKSSSNVITKAALVDIASTIGDVTVRTVLESSTASN